MAVVVNTPGRTEDTGGGIGTIIGLIILAVVLYMLFVYGLPALREGAGGAPEVNVPSRVDVNFEQR